MHVVGQCAVVYCCCVVVNSLRVVGLVCAWVHACLHLCVCGSCNSALLRHARMGVSHLLWGKSPALPCPALPCPALPCPALPCPAQFERGQKFAHIQQYKCHPVEVQMCICAVYAVWGGSYG